MEFVNKTTLNFIVNQGGRFVESSLLKKTPIKKMEGCKYLPKLTADIVVISKGQPSHKEVSTNELAQSLLIPDIIQIASAKIDVEKLKALSKQGLSLNELAEKFNVTFTQIRRALDKAGIATDAQKEFRVLQNYFNASSREEKAMAFAQVDKYLEQIAKEEHKQRKGTLFEDCLQDVRLRFFEAVDKSKQNGVSAPYNTLKLVRNTKPLSNSKIKTVKSSKADVVIIDRGIEMFENKDLDNYLWNYINANLKYREADILTRYFKSGKNYKEIGDCFCLTRERVRCICIDLVSQLEAKCKRSIPFDYFFYPAKRNS